MEMEHPESKSPPEADVIPEDDGGKGDRVQTLEQEKKELWERFVRLNADFDNFRKRAQREKSELVSYANEELLRKLLPVIDNLERALAATASGAEEGAVRKGVEMVLRQFQDVLASEGVIPIKAQGEPFDPHRHESVGTVETDGEENMVAEEIQKGYFLNERLLRPSMVKTSVRPVRTGDVEGQKNE